MTQTTVRIIAVLFALAATNATAQSIRTDASWGRTAQTLSGPAYIIPESLGKVAGNNLFQSFQVFNINAGESATFTTTTATLQNVINRVSGGGASSINGLLQMVPAAGSAPNFFFINPAGMTFGAGASVDVPGAFHVSTANYLKFADGTMFSAGTGADSTFTVAAPQAFGFLGTTRASITITDGAVIATKPTQSISVVAGDIEINDGSLGSLIIPGGNIRVGAIGQTAQEIEFTGALPAAYGNLTIRNGGGISQTSSGPMSSGTIAVSAGNITVDSGSYMASIANASSSVIAGSVTVSATGKLSVANGGSIVSATASSGNAGAVIVNAGTVSIDGQAVEGNTAPTRISSEAFAGTGNAGNVMVSVAGNLSIINGGTISADTNTSGSAGTVNVTASSINIDGRAVQGAHYLSGISSNANPMSTGNAGSVAVTATGGLSISNGGLISSSTFASGNAGSVKVTADSIAIDGQALSGNKVPAGIFSSAFSGSSDPRPVSGDAGSVTVATTGMLSIINGGIISSDTYTTGNAGPVSVSAGSISIDGRGAQGNFFPTGISSSAASSSAGNAGSITVTATGNLSILNGGGIETDTASIGKAGSINASAGSITIDGRGAQGNYLPTGIFSQAESGSSKNANAGSVAVLAPGKLSLVNGGSITSDTYGDGDAGSVSVSAGSMSIDGQSVQKNSIPTGISSDTNSGSRGHGGNVSVSVTGDLAIANGGNISSDTFGAGNAGLVNVGAGNISIDGQEVQGAFASTGISSSAQTGSRGTGGDVVVTVAGNLTIANGGHIASLTLGSANAGTVNVSADSVLIDGQSVQGNFISTGISSNASYVSTNNANAGTVNVVVRGNLAITNGGYISSDTEASGNAGSVNVSAGSISIDGQAAQGADLATGISSDASLYSTGGHAGSVTVTTAGNLSIINGGTISTKTESSGDAGSVNLSAGSVSIDGKNVHGLYFATGISSDATPDSTGNAGNVNVSAKDGISISGSGSISSSTGSSGNAGSVNATAGSITIDGRGRVNDTGILSQALSGSTGKAGDAEVLTTRSLSITNGGEISSSTFGPGSAGAVKVSAGTLSVDGSMSSINASAAAGSSGQTGSVIVNASDSIALANGGSLSIQNDATVVNPAKLTPTTLSVSATNITLKDAQITAASSGNVAASDIQVSFSNRLSLDPSSITTSANTGNGGSIGIQGGKLITLDNSQITTSVLGASGNGGDISLSARALVMSSGFVQANTAALTASGGNVSIDVGALIPSGNTLVLGSRSAHSFTPGVFGANVIEAASPSGLSGNIQVTSPALDLAGALGGLTTATVDFGTLGQDPCRVGAGSSLTPLGHGGLPPMASGAIRPEYGLRASAPLANRAITPPAQLVQLAYAPRGMGCH